MKLKDKLVLREVAGNWIIFPIAGSDFDLNGLLKLNDTGALLWKKLEAGADFEGLIDTVINEYDVTREVAETDVKTFLDKLSKAGCIEG